MTDVSFAELNLPLDGRYQVSEILSARLWARTYLAHDLRRPNQTECVIHHLKTIPIVPSYGAMVRELFAKEAVVLEQLGIHAQIPQLLAWFEDDYGFYAVQEFIHGRSLSLDLQPQQRWSPQQVLKLLQDVLAPLAWTHRHGSMHGNLKPENLIRRAADGQLVAIDFSGMGMLQRTLMAANGLFVPPQTAAQEGYQPLEQLQGLPCAASDIYALGMIAVQALTGMKPTEFRVNPDPITILWQEHLPPTSSSLQRNLVAVLDNMLQWDVSLRYANANQVLLALQDVSQTEVPLDEPVFAIHPVIESAVESTACIEVTAAVEASDLNQVEAPAWIESSNSATPSGDGRMPGIVTPATQAESSTNLPPSAPTSPLEATPPTRQQWIKSPLSIKTAIANPSVRLGAGSVAIATTFAAVGWGLLHSVDWSQKTDGWWNRLARISNGNSNQTSLKTLTEQWRTDWQQATVTFQQAETAFNQKEWAKAKQLAAAMPDIPYWRDRGNTLIQQIDTQAQSNAAQHLQTAFEYAYQREFTKALVQLEQIPPESPLHATAQPKVKEYQEKEDIKAWFDLQQAYNRAIVQDFTQALSYLYQIPPETEAYTIAQKKIVEYKEKEKISAKTISDIGSDIGKDTKLQHTRTAVANDQQHHQQSETWLQLAQQQMRQGQLEAAIATLDQIEIGTLAYAKARDQRIELTALLHRPTQGNGMVVRANQRVNINPGQQLRESQSVIIGRAELHSVK